MRFSIPVATFSQAYFGLDSPDLYLLSSLRRRYQLKIEICGYSLASMARFDGATEPRSNCSPVLLIGVATSPRFVPAVKRELRSSLPRRGIPRAQIPCEPTRFLIGKQRHPRHHWRSME